jgi:hypothetical protein
MFEEEDHSFRQCTIRQIAALLLLAVVALHAHAWPKHHAAKSAPRSTSIAFIEKTGACIIGPILKIEPKTLTVSQSPKPPILIQRASLLQASQTDSLLFSARSSWADVESLHLHPRESVILKLRNGTQVTGRPTEITDTGVLFSYGPFLKKSYSKAQIATVDYLRIKPNSAAFDDFAQQSPALLFFYPESYDRVSGLEGRVPVRLYDAVQPQDNTPLKCAQP